MGDKPEDAWESVWCLREYHPYHHGNNPDFGQSDRRLLDMKIDGKAYAIAAEASDIGKALTSLEIPEPIVIALVPGHEAKTTNAGCPLAQVAQALAASDKRLKADIDLIIRHTTIPKLATGGNRSIEVHLNSLRVTRRVPGTTVIVLDDVVTTGNSMAAARKLLTDKAAKYVAGIAIGQTV